MEIALVLQINLYQYSHSILREIWNFSWDLKIFLYSKIFCGIVGKHWVRCYYCGEYEEQASGMHC